MCRSPSTRAFTLVELLVVITIIVVLLSLLTPALDKAIYQADLAVCGSNLHGMGTGVFTYASNHSRFYPGNGRLWTNAQVLADWYVGSYDLRQVMGDFLSIKSFLDPLAGGVDLSLQANQQGTRTDGGPAEGPIIFANYAWYYGWGYPGEEYMSRMGRSFTYQGDDFNVLAADQDIRHETEAGGWHITTHPDDAGVLIFETLQDAPWGLVALQRATASWWARGGGVPRGTLDQNFLWDDGSVIRINDVEVVDSRLERVPDRGDKAEELVRKVQVPAAR